VASIDEESVSILWLLRRSSLCYVSTRHFDSVVGHRAVNLDELRIEFFHFILMSLVAPLIDCPALELICLDCH
jgi:hypothetical protein